MRYFIQIIDIRFLLKRSLFSSAKLISQMAKNAANQATPIYLIFNRLFFSGQQCTCINNYIYCQVNIR